MRAPRRRRVSRRDRAQGAFRACPAPARASVIVWPKRARKAAARCEALEISGLTAGVVAFLDDVRLVRTGGNGSTRVTNSFASDGWTAVEPPSDAHDGSGLVMWMREGEVLEPAWGAVRYDDACRVAIRNRGAVHRTERLAAGTYRLSVASVGRFCRYGDTPEELVQRYGDNRFEAWFGTTDGAVTNVIGQFGVTRAER